MKNLKLFNVTWSTTTAGPSPDKGLRTELFLKGCKRAENKNPCIGCFNKEIWENTAAYSHSPSSIRDNLLKHAPNKYVTIGGGEPLDQIEGLIELVKLLKESGFHILVYTWRSLDKMLQNNYQGLLPNDVASNDYNIANDIKELLSHIDILVDGEYIKEKRLYNPESTDSLTNSIGSGNQIVWDIREYNNGGKLKGYKMEDLASIYVKETNGDLVYIIKDGASFLEIKTKSTEEGVA